MQTFIVSEAPARLQELPAELLSLDWLRRGFAALLWSSSRSLASFHELAARTLGHPSGMTRPSEGNLFQLSGSFIQFLFERQGIQRLHRFFRRAEEAGVEAAARAAFGKSFAELEGDWKSMLGELPR